MNAVSIKEKQDDKYIKKHNAAIRSYSEMSLLERKIANVLLYNAYPNLVTQNIHAITITQLLNLLSLKTNDYQKLKQAIKQLMLTIIEWDVAKKENPNVKPKDDKLFDSKENWRACTLLSSVQINGTLIKYEYSEILRDLFYQPSFYSKISLCVQSKFRSAYSISLYENCLSYLNCGTTGWIDIEAFRKLMGVKTSQYKIFRDFNRRVLQPAVQEVNKVSNVDVICETKRFGRVVSLIKLCVSNKKSCVEEKIFQETANNSFTETMKMYGVSNTKMKSWIVQHGENYIKEKLNLIKNSTVAIKNPIAFLNKAIKENWCDPKVKSEPFSGIMEIKETLETQRLSKEENMFWFNGLTDQEKIKCFDKAIFKFPMFKTHMEYRNIKFLDENFINSDLFIMFIQILDRSR